MLWLFIHIFYLVSRFLGIFSRRCHSLCKLLFIDLYTNVCSLKLLPSHDWIEVYSLLYLYAERLYLFLYFVCGIWSRYPKYIKGSFVFMQVMIVFISNRFVLYLINCFILIKSDFRLIWDNKYFSSSVLLLLYDEWKEWFSPIRSSSRKLYTVWSLVGQI